LGGELDGQTPYEASVVLHEYFINNSINSNILLAPNHNHGVFRFKSNGIYYGNKVIADFVKTGNYNPQDILAHPSDFKNFDTADYSLFFQPPESSTESPQYKTELNGPLIATTVIIVVLLCVIAAMIGFYLHKKKIFMRFWMRSDNKNDIPLTRGG